MTTQMIGILLIAIGLFITVRSLFIYILYSNVEYDANTSLSDMQTHSSIFFSIFNWSINPRDWLKR